jgi:hypothetical protein
MEVMLVSICWPHDLYGISGIVPFTFIPLLPVPQPSQLSECGTGVGPR